MTTSATCARRRICAVVAIAMRAAPFAQTAREAPHERPVVTVGPGPQRLAIDDRLLRSGAPFRVLQRGERFYAEDGLTDLRLVTEGGRPVPHLLIHASSPEREWIRGSLLGVAATKKSSGVEVDLGAPAAVDMIRVDGLAGPAPEAADARGQRRSRALDDARGRRNAVRSAGRAAAAEYPRFCGWTVSILPHHVERCQQRPRAESVARIGAARLDRGSAASGDARRRDRTASERTGISRYRVRLPGARLPIVALDLDVGPGAAGGHVYRRAVVSESRFAGLEAAPVELGRAMLSRVVRDGITASALRVPIAVPAEAELELTIDDGANEPLDLRAVAVVLAELAVDLLRSAGRRGDSAVGRPDAAATSIRSRSGAQLGRPREGARGEVG